MKPFGRLVMLIAMLAASVILLSVLTQVLIKTIYGFGVMDLYPLTDNVDDPAKLSALKLSQIISQTALFIIPPLLYVKLVEEKNIAEHFLLRKVQQPSTWFWAFISVFTIIPLIGLLVQWNMNMDLPESLSSVEAWMKQSEEAANLVIESFLQTSTLSGLLVNLLMIAAIPAIGEELLFRGVLQQLLHRMIGKPHLPVIITALLFSAFHMQFYGFLPRFMLGVVLGYAFYITGSLWVPILIHFVNNGFSVIAAYLFYNDTIGQNYDEIGMTSQITPIILSVVLTAYVYFRMWRNEKSQSIISQDY
ncbi:MAG: CPBP family intramembrane glutamic endopeptidase [Bacteroidota bacterium]